MTLRVIRWSELTETPWRNGGGVTREIARHGPDGSPVWRLSMADVARDGPFSDFSGMTRILTVVAGNGMILSGPEGAMQAAPADPVAFDGATPITAQLTDGPLRDLNLIFDPRRCAGRVAALHGPGRIRHPERAGQTLGLHCVTGTAHIGGAHRLDPGDTALISNEGLRLDLDCGAWALLVSLTMVSPGVPGSA